MYIYVKEGMLIIICSDVNSGSGWSMYACERGYVNSGQVVFDYVCTLYVKEGMLI